MRPGRCAPCSSHEASASATKGSVTSSGAGSLLAPRRDRRGGGALRRHRAGVEQVDPERAAPRLRRVAAHQRLQAGLARRIGTPEGGCGLGRGGGHEDRPARRRGAQQGIEAADQAPIDPKVEPERLLPILRGVVPHRAQLPQRAGVGDEDVEAAEAFGQRAAQPVDLLAVASVSIGTRSRARLPRAARRRPPPPAPRWCGRRGRAARLRQQTGATAAPMPREAPVTSAIRPSRRGATAPPSLNPRAGRAAPAAHQPVDPKAGSDSRRRSRRRNSAGAPDRGPARPWPGRGRRW